MSELLGAIKRRTLAALAPLVHLPLTAVQRAADMRILHFGALREDGGGGVVGEYSLHVICSWRLEAGDGGIISGSADIFKSQGEIEPDGWDYDVDGNMQDMLLQSWLAAVTPVTVTALAVDGSLGCELCLSDKSTLRVFIDTTRGECWRLFKPGTGLPHFVISGEMCRAKRTVL